MLVSAAGGGGMESPGALLALKRNVDFTGSKVARK